MENERIRKERDQANLELKLSQKEIAGIKVSNSFLKKQHIIAKMNIDRLQNESDRLNDMRRQICFENKNY